MKMMPNAAPNGRAGLRERMGQSRYAAFTAHFAVSTVVLAAVCAITFFLWYPQPYFSVDGTGNALRVLAAIFLGVGPLLTLVVFKPGKWGLKFDLYVIASLQLATLLYGTFMLYRGRPAFTVFAVDRFYVLSREDIVASQLADRTLMASARIGIQPDRGPLLVAALRPDDPIARDKLLTETLLEGQPDIERRPEFWTRYANGVSDVLARARPLSTLGAAAPKQTIASIAAGLGRPVTDLGYLPLVSRKHDFSMIVDLTNGRPVGVIDVDPWGTSTAATNR